MSTQLSPDAAARLFLTPARSPMQDPSNSGTKPDRVLSTPRGAIATWSEGDGETVLLVHGWSGKHTDMQAFVAPLVAARCKVVSMDLVAHGESEGKVASIPDLAESILSVANAVGPIHGVIAHSIGCAATAVAMKKGMQALRAVLIAPPARYAHFARAFAMQVGVEPEALLDALRSRDIDVDSIDLPLMAPGLQSRPLVIHSADDQVVPFANGKAIAAAWPEARLLEYDGLGHKRILFDPTVIAAAVSFLTE